MSNKEYIDEYILDENENVDPKLLQIAITNHEFAAIMSRLNEINHSCGFFDICPISDVYQDLNGRGKTLSGMHDTSEYNYLRRLHCVHWKQMSSDTRKGLYKVILELLNCPRIGFDEKKRKFYDIAYVDLSRKGNGSDGDVEAADESEKPWWAKLWK